MKKSIKMIGLCSIVLIVAILLSSCSFFESKYIEPTKQEFFDGLWKNNFGISEDTVKSTGIFDFYPNESDYCQYSEEDISFVWISFEDRKIAVESFNSISNGIKHKSNEFTRINTTYFIITGKAPNFYAYAVLEGNIIVLGVGKDVDEKKIRNTVDYIMLGGA